MELIKLYKEFLKIVNEECIYLKKEKLSDREITQFTDKKRIVMDKIDKSVKSNISKSIKQEILDIILKIQIKEKEINNIYRQHIEKVENGLKSIRTEEKLKKTYYGNVGTNFDKRFFDKKK